MNRYLMKMLLRSIRSTLGRYLAILAIVALGVGFFAGLKSSYPAMLETGDRYLRQQRLGDFQLLSTLGFDGKDVAAFLRLDGVQAAEGGYFADAFFSYGGQQEVYHVLSLPQQVNLPVVTEGRLPRKSGECLADSRCFGKDDIGKSISLSTDNDEDTLSLLPQRRYTIVGIGKSPRYISDYRGDTALGSGRIRGWLMLTPSDFESEAYHELSLWCDLPGRIYSAEYQSARDRLTDPVKALLNSRGVLRQQELRDRGQRELDDARRKLDAGWDEYRDGKKEAEDKLVEGRVTLSSSAWQLEQAQKKLDAGRQELESGMARIPSAREEITAGREEIAAREQELAAGLAELESANQELSAHEGELAAGWAQLEAAKALTLAPYQQRMAAIQGEIALIQAGLDALDPEDPLSVGTAAVLRSRLSQQQAALSDAQAAYNQAAAPFAAQETELLAAQEAVAAGRSQYWAGMEELRSGEAAIAQAKEQLDAAEAELNAAEKEYPGRLAELEAAQAQINWGWSQYQEGLTRWEEERDKAEEELREAEQELKDAEEELSRQADSLEESLQLELFTLTRSENRGYVTFESDIQIVDGLADVFPFFFALVAALVCVTTMTRMVGEERTVIGTLKAMGCSSSAVMSKYLLYSGSASLLGCVFGFFLGSTAIPYLVWVAYGIMYTYAKLQFYYSPVMILLSLAVSVLGTVLVTWLACGRELREKPAELVRPKAPRNGRRILLERLGPLWRALPFLSKVSLRNAFRHPLRVLMMLLGIGGCTALMVAGFGARDSIAKIADLQFEQVFLYDMSVSFDGDSFSSDDAVLRLWDKEARRCALTWQEPVTVRIGGRERSTRVIAAKPGALDSLVSLHDDVSQLPFPGKGEAVVTEKLAQLLDLSAGDTVTLETDSGDLVTLRLTGICKNYLGHYIFISIDSLSPRRCNSALISLSDQTDADSFGAALRAKEGVSYVSLVSQEREQMERSMASIDLLVLMLVVCSGALAFITLYNLTNINILERIREIATVKVLGFYPGETAAYVLQENLLLSVLGAALGLWMGKLLHAVVVRAVVVENMSYEIRISIASYVISFAVTLVFTVLTDLFMSRKLETIQMAESLKSVE